MRPQVALEGNQRDLGRVLFQRPNPSLPPPPAHTHTHTHVHPIPPSATSLSASSQASGLEQLAKKKGKKKKAIDSFQNNSLRLLPVD